LLKKTAKEEDKEEDYSDPEDTPNSQQIKQQKSSLTDCKAQERVNYESDVGLRDREDKSKDNYRQGAPGSSPFLAEI